MNLDVNGRPLILHAADYGHHAIVNYLISKGADPNVGEKTSSFGNIPHYNHIFKAKDSYGISALLAAIWEGHTECVKVLVSKVNNVFFNAILIGNLLFPCWSFHSMPNECANARIIYLYV